MTYIKTNGTEYPASIAGRMADRDWGGRASKSITLTMTHAAAVQLFVDGLAWSIVQRDTVPIYDTDGNTTGKTEEQVLSGYDAVLHLVTCAKGAEFAYNYGNAARYESVEVAREKDDKTLRAWSRHPALHVIDNSVYCLAGPITDNRDGTITAKMGQKTASDVLAELEATYDGN